MAHAILERDAVTQRRALAKAITLLESSREDHRAQADVLLSTLLPHTGNALRIGISGVPGVGKSTLIEALGMHLIGLGHRIAVLAIDPSSTLSGGSILGDKTRMERLSVHPAAYIRPSPSRGTLGGVAEKTRESILVCEAAGFDVILVETVGVGQSEVAVHGMTDMYCVLQLPNAGDDLQAMKKGVLERADLVIVNKADADPDGAMRTLGQIASSLHLSSRHGACTTQGWVPQVLAMAALPAQGIEQLWEQVQEFRNTQQRSGWFVRRRQEQAMAWLWERIETGLAQAFRSHPQVKLLLPQVLDAVRDGKLAPSVAARNLLAAQSECAPNPSQI